MVVSEVLFCDYGWGCGVADRRGLSSSVFLWSAAPAPTVGRRHLSESCFRRYAGRWSRGQVHQPLAGSVAAKLCRALVVVELIYWPSPSLS